MIVRTEPEGLVLITQPDHAALAERVMAAWQRDGLPESPLRDIILLATREHDNGWIEEDAAPIVDPTTGQILDFINAPEDVRQGIWPRGVERLHDHPYAAALVAEHALTVYERYREIAAWDPFFARMDALRDGELARAQPRTLTELRRDYFYVRMGDLISLAFCNAWKEPQKLGAYELRLDGDVVRITPDPFAGERVALEVIGRSMPDRRYVGAADAATEFRAAPPVRIAGVATGHVAGR